MSSDQPQVRFRGEAKLDQQGNPAEAVENDPISVIGNFKLMRCKRAIASHILGRKFMF
jgi:hypothetical protein